MADDAPNGREVLRDVEVAVIDQCLHRAPVDEAHRNRGQAVRIDFANCCGLGPKNLFGHGAERRAVALERGADLLPDGRVPRAQRSVLEEQRGPVRLVRKAMHLLQQERAQPIRRLAALCYVVGDV